MEIKSIRARGTDKAEVMQVIKTTSIMGDGTEEDPVRLVYQYWDFEGNMIAINDTLNNGMASH